MVFVVVSFMHAGPREVKAPQTPAPHAVTSPTEGTDLATDTALLDDDGDLPTRVASSDSI